MSMSVGGVDVPDFQTSTPSSTLLNSDDGGLDLTHLFTLHQKKKSLISECIKKKLKFPKREKAPEGTQNAPKCSKIEKVHKKYLAK